MNDKMNHALDEIDNKYLSEAEGYCRRRRPHLLTAIIALALVILAVIAIPNKYGEPVPPTPTVHNSIEEVPDPSGIQSPDSWNLSNLVAAPVYPEMVQRPDRNDYADYNEYAILLSAWEENQAAQYNQPAHYASSLTGFFQQSIPLFLDASENSAYSPVNVYMALAMLAESTAGTSRRQILDSLCVDSIEQLREQVSYVWNAHYCDDGVTTLLLGNSLWLDENYDFHQDTADLLAEHYYAASFRGDLGTDAMDQQLQAWLNANTGGLLKEQAENIKMDPATVFALASTVYFAADWENEFLPKNTQDMPFHCGEYDLITPFMRQTLQYGAYYRGSNFGAVCLELEGENGMWLILPDEGYTVADILKSDEYLNLTMTGHCERRGIYEIHLSLPKFDVVSEVDLTDGLKEMGITDVFDPTVSDFSSLSDEPNLFVGSASHASRVMVDEDGVLAAAFTVLLTYGTSAIDPPPEMDFTLDRPFLFVISSRDDLPLFVGSVVEP